MAPPQSALLVASAAALAASSFALLGSAGCNALFGGTTCFTADECAAGAVCDRLGRCVVQASGVDVDEDAGAGEDGGGASDDAGASFDEDAGAGDAGGALVDGGAPPDGGASTDAGPAADAGVVSVDAGPPCVDADTMFDDFESTAPLADVWDEVNTDGVTTIGKESGRLRVALAPNADASFAWVVEEVATPGNARVTMEVVQAPAQLGTLYMSFFSNDIGGEVGLFLVGPVLDVVLYDLSQAFPYEPAAHRFWRVASTPGMIAVQVSGDSVTWTTLLDRSVPVQSVDGFVEIGAGTEDAQSAPGSAVIDDVTIGPGTGTDCP